MLGYEQDGMLMKMLALYDGQCSLCRETKKWCQKLDSRQKVEWISLQEYEKKKPHSSLKASDLRREMHVILPDGRIVVGYWAVRKLMLAFPTTYLFGLLLHLPFVHLVGNPVYRLIARNRYKWKRKNCDNGSCTL